MKVVIIGAGRLGSALTQRSVALGHETRVLSRSAYSRSNRRLPKKAILETISKASASEVDIVLIAAPAWSDRSKEKLVSSFLRKLDKAVPICSAVAYPDAPIKEWSLGRPFIRFVCSPAVANVEREPLVIIYSTSRIARAAFVNWLGPARIEKANRRTFDRLVYLFLASALHCETLRRISESLKPNITASESQFAAATLNEAFALVEACGFDPKQALNACLTPRGMTYPVVRRFLGRYRPSSVRKAGY